LEHLVLEGSIRDAVQRHPEKKIGV
jgi:hypothetical protein